MKREILCLYGAGKNLRLAPNDAGSADDSNKTAAGV